MKKEKTKSLAGKVVVITGASSGIRRATAQVLADQGAILVLAARRKDVLEEVAAQCAELGAKSLVVPTDVTQPDALPALAAAAVAFGGKIDVWINNAGSGAIGPYDETPMAAHEHVIQINLLGYLRGAHAVLPIFIEQGYGHLINNISLGAFAPMPYGVSYSASKYGLRGFSQALKSELSKYPAIQVSDVFPAFIDTPGFQHAANYSGKVIKPAPPVYKPHMVAETIAGLIHAPKEEVMAGGFGYVARYSNALFPTLTRWAAARFMEHYFKVADPAPVTVGNLFESSSIGTSVSGGWGSEEDAAKRSGVAMPLLWAGLAGALYFLFREKKKNRAAES
jgi:short-subunit dehydrogenase